jgi:hypothetical protein
MLETVSRWSDFNVAMAGASAALAGLVIVAASVNIQKIVSAGTLTARLAAAIATLVLALVVSAVGLVPGIDLLWYGLVTIVVALGAAWFQAHATRVVMRDPQQRARVAKSALGILPIAAYLAAGSMMAQGLTGGLMLAAAGCLVAIVSAILVSWIVLVEVLR